MVKKVSAFTLVEAIISMIIISVVTATMVPTLTKIKSRIETVSRRGQYACWVEGNQLYEQYMDERTARTDPQKVDQCIFKLDLVPTRYYILAAGAGNNKTPGQVITNISPGISSALLIDVGRTTNDGITRIKSIDGTIEEINAKPGETATNGLIPSNIKSCRLLSAGTPCPDASGTQASCEVVEAAGYDSENNYTRNYKVRINGCEQVDVFGDYVPSNIFDFSSLEYSTGSQKVNNSSNFTEMAKPNQKYYKIIGKDDNYKMNFEFIDSSFLSSGENISKMSSIISVISILRKSTLTDKIVGLNPGAPKKNGAVLILW